MAGVKWLATLSSELSDKQAHSVGRDRFECGYFVAYFGDRERVGTLILYNFQSAKRAISVLDLNDPFESLPPIDGFFSRNRFLTLSYFKQD